MVNKRLRVPVAPLALSTVMSALGLLTSLPPALLEQAWLRPAAPAALWAAVYYALVPGVLGFWLWFAGAERLAGAQASLMTAVMPVSALALSAAVLGERVSAWQMGAVRWCCWRCLRHRPLALGAESGRPRYNQPVLQFAKRTWHAVPARHASQTIWNEVD